MRRAPAAVLLGVLAAALAGGCRSTPVREPDALPWIDDPRTALAALHRRHTGLRTFSAECDFTVHRADGSSVGLGGIVVAEPPDRLRLRVFKLTRAVADLTVRPDGIWLWTAERAERGIDKLLGDTEQASIWPRLGAALLDPRGGHIAAEEPRSFRLRGPADDEGRYFEATVAKAGPLLTEVLLHGVEGEAEERFELAGYEMVAGQPWPTRLRAEHARGSIDIELSAVEIDGELPDTAFTPPGRAQRRGAPGEAKPR